MSFANLKKQSKLGSLTAKLVKEVEKMNNNGASGDERLWKLDVDKSGNGYAVIRFLPAPEGKIFRSLNYIPMRFKAWVDGISKTV